MFAYLHPSETKYGVLVEKKVFGMPYHGLGDIVFFCGEQGP